MARDETPDAPTVEVDRRAEQTENGMWRDAVGAVGPMKPGSGPRSNPRGWFPTGVDVGEPLPTVVARDQHGRVVDVDRHRAGRPAALVVHRSAVW